MFKIKNNLITFDSIYTSLVDAIKSLMVACNKMKSLLGVQRGNFVIIWKTVTDPTASFFR